MSCYYISDLKERLSKMVIAYNNSGEVVTAGDLEATGAMALLLNLLTNLYHVHQKLWHPMSCYKSFRS